MKEYRQTIDVDAPVDLVYEFVSTYDNIPRFTPGVQNVYADESDRVMLDGRGFQTEASVHLDPDERTMHWNAGDRDRYRGELQVVGDARASQVAVKLEFSADEAARIEGSSHPDAIEHDLTGALQSIKHLCEAEASKVRAANEDRGYLG